METWKRVMCFRFLPAALLTIGSFQVYIPICSKWTWLQASGTLNSMLPMHSNPYSQLRSMPTAFDCLLRIQPTAKTHLVTAWERLGRFIVPLAASSACIETCLSVFRKSQIDLGLHVTQSACKLCKMTTPECPGHLFIFMHLSTSLYLHTGVCTSIQT